ncbi:MAG: ABC transporter transmembrane domain-containing protein [Bacillota bacterium]
MNKGIGSSCSAHLNDLRAGFRVIRMFNLGQWATQRMAEANRQVMQNQLYRVRLESCLAATNSLSGFSFFIPIAVGAYWVLKGQTTMGTVVGVMQLYNGCRFSSGR